MRTSTFTTFGRAFAVFAVAAVVLGNAPRTAQAYGKDALWQVGLSFNCNTPASCGSALGGFWAWVEFDEGFTGDLTAAGCSHLSSPAGPGLAGADAFQADFTWAIAPSG